jgi:hypothetical protein
LIQAAENARSDLGPRGALDFLFRGSDADRWAKNMDGVRRTVETGYIFLFFACLGAGAWK